MKSILTMFAVAAMMTSASFAEDSKYKEGGCCAKAKAKGEACAHPCCVEAEKANKVCEKCNPPKK